MSVIIGMFLTVFSMPVFVGYFAARRDLAGLPKILLTAAVGLVIIFAVIYLFGQMADVYMRNTFFLWMPFQQAQSANWLGDPLKLALQQMWAAGPLFLGSMVIFTIFRESRSR